MKKMFICLTFLFLCFALSPLRATEEYAEKTNKSCSFCHLESSGGGELTRSGEEYLEKLLEEAEGEDSGSLSTVRRDVLHYVRLLIGFVHIFTAFFWFGTILYVHIILKPAYAAHGLPRGEVKVGLVSILIMAVSGTILTLFRVPSFSFFLNTRFGIFLFIKIILFLIMVLTALYVVIVIGPKLKNSENHKDSAFKSTGAWKDIHIFDGQEGRPAHIVYKERIYDVSGSDHWPDGKHFMRHKAGQDLTGLLSQAPHGEDKILAMPEISSSEGVNVKDRKTTTARLFFIMAYLNLAFVFLITMVLAFWKWW